MLPKSTQRVSEVIALANNIAREYEQEYVGTEHVLLAIQREGTGVGAKVLKKHSISVAKLQSAVDKLVKAQLEETWVFGRLPGTPHFKNVMASAVEEAQAIESTEVSTEHMLLALLKEEGCVAQKALSALGLTYDTAHQDIRDIAKSGSDSD